VAKKTEEKKPVEVKKPEEKPSIEVN